MTSVSIKQCLKTIQSYFCQVDNFLISCKLESVVKCIFDYIGNKLQLHNEKVPPSKYLGPAKDYNGINLIQTQHYIDINCAGYI